MFDTRAPRKNSARRQNTASGSFISLSARPPARRRHDDAVGGRDARHSPQFFFLLRLLALDLLCKRRLVLGELLFFGRGARMADEKFCRCSATFTLGKDKERRGEEAKRRCQELPFFAVSYSPPARPRHLLSFPPSFLLLPQSSRRSIHWSDIPPLRSREERCSVGVENRARARGAERNRPGGTWRRKRGRLFPFTDVPGEGRSAETGVSQPRSRVTWRRWKQDLYAIRMRKAAAAASAKSVCLPRHKRKWWH